MMYNGNIIQNVTKVYFLFRLKREEDERVKKATEELQKEKEMEAASSDEEVVQNKTPVNKSDIWQAPWYLQTVLQICIFSGC